MTSNRRLSGAVALGLSVALTGAFAAPSFAAPAAGATVESSSFTTVTVDDTEYGQVTDTYTDGTKIATRFIDDGNEKLDEGETVLDVTEISTDGTETVTVEDGDTTTVTVTAKDGTVTETVTDEAAGTKVVTVTNTDDTSTVTTTTTEGEKDSDDGRTVTVEVEEFDDEGDSLGSTETVTNTTSVVTTETVTVTDADGTTVTKTITKTTTDEIVETVTEYNADGEAISMKQTTREQTSKATVETVTEAGVDGEIGTKDDVVTVTETDADGSGTVSVYDGEGNLVSKRPFEGKAPTAPEKVVFSDNPEGSAFYASVQWMAENGISVGYADGTYKKNKDVTRGETTSFLFSYEDPEFVAPETSPFGDLNVGGAFFTPITWAASEEITVGDTKGNFRTSAPVTRGEFAAFLYRVSGVDFEAPAESPFGDLNAKGANYEAITWLASEEITVGDTQGDFNQSDEITRGEISAFMQRYDANVAG